MTEEKALVPQAEVGIIGFPSEVIEAASEAAKALKSVLDKKARRVIINKETYLEYEDWQTVGQFYGYGVRTHGAEPCEIEGVKGAKAFATLIQLKTGLVIGGAEAYCLRDEANWEQKPWFQLASMAQTRAGAKALRNRLAWVVVLAGYKPTPAEEMVTEEKPKEQPARSTPPEAATELSPTRTFKNVGELLTQCNACGVSRQEVFKFLKVTGPLVIKPDEAWPRILEGLIKPRFQDK